MTTFSQLVDDLVVELVRPDLRAALATYANQTVRELHFKPNHNSGIHYDANREEEELAFTTDGTWLWSLPSATRFQDVESIYIDDLGMYVPRKNPRIALEPTFEPNADLYWYRSGPQLAIQGVANGWTGKISYFMFAQTLAYKASGSRLITYSPDTDSYTLVGGGTPSEAQLKIETHWVLQRWADTVKEGVRAKAWKRLADEGRARMSFSAFESMRTSMWQSEPSSQ